MWKSSCEYAEAHGQPLPPENMWPWQYGDALIAVLAAVEQAPAPSPVEAGAEIGWLIERGNAPAYLWADDMGFKWTFNVNEAIRFARRADGEQIARIIGDDAQRVAEHLWMGSSPATSLPSRDEIAAIVYGAQKGLPSSITPNDYQERLNDRLVAACGERT